MSRTKYLVLSSIIVVLAAYLLFFSGLMPKKTRIVFVSDENKIIRKICEDFNNKNSDINLDYIAKPDYDAEEYIPKNKADIWLPFNASSIYHTDIYFAANNNNNELFGKITAIAHSPLILVGSRERFEKINEMTVPDIYDIVADKKKWSDLNGNPQWGNIRFACPNPYIEDIGAVFLSLFVYDYYKSVGNSKKELLPYDIQKDSVIQHVKPFIENVGEHERFAYSLLEDFKDKDRPRIDMGILYENEFFESLQIDQELWQRVKILYPNPTISKQLVLAQLKGTHENPKKAEAVKRFEEYLLSDAVQQNLLSLGYRPMKPDKETRELLEEKYSSYGIKAVLPELENSLQPLIVNEIQNMAGKYVPAVR